MTTVADDALAARTDAIEASGWGRRFRAVQPHNCCWWVVLAGVVYGATQLVGQVSGSLPAEPEAYAVALLLFGGYAVGFWLFLRSIDRYERLSLPLIITGFLWGGVAAAFGIALHANTATISLYGKAFGQPFASDWGPALTAPIWEELGKGAGFLMLLHLAPQIIRSPRAALFAGAFVGLGFQAFEDVIYGASGSQSAFNGDQVGSVAGVALLRFFGGIFSHAAYTGLFSVGVLFLVGSPVVARRAGRGLAFMALAMIVHGVWDASGAIGGGSALTFLPIVAVSVASAVGLWLAFRASSGYEQAWTRAVLAPEAADGVITAEELDAAAGTPKQRRAYRHSAHRHRRRHMLEAFGDLTHELAVSRGETTPAVEHARAEIERLRARDER